MEVKGDGWGEIERQRERHGFSRHRERIIR